MGQRFTVFTFHKMASSGEVVFMKGQNGDDGSDIWDDTALIKAYDDAVNTVKSQIGANDATALPNDGYGETAGEKVAVASSEDQGESRKRKPKPKGNKRRKKNKKNQNMKIQWKVGELCQAVYSGDGGVYDAVIKLIDTHRKVCVVHYCGYGNEEEQPLAQLLPINPDKATDFSFSESDESRPPSAAGSFRRAQTRNPPPPPPTWPWRAPSTPTIPPFPSQMGAFPSMPPLYPPMPAFPGFHGAPNLPSIPPPPPITDEDIGDDKEALYSMLISWYMSGYHTGYYQGLKQGRRGDTRGNPRGACNKESASTNNAVPETKDSQNTDR